MYKHLFEEHFYVVAVMYLLPGRCAVSLPIMHIEDVQDACYHSRQLRLEKRQTIQTLTAPSGHHVVSKVTKSMHLLTRLVILKRLEKRSRGSMEWDNLLISYLISLV